MPTLGLRSRRFCMTPTSDALSYYPINSATVSHHKANLRKIGGNPLGQESPTCLTQVSRRLIHPQEPIVTAIPKENLDEHPRHLLEGQAVTGQHGERGEEPCRDRPGVRTMLQVEWGCASEPPPGTISFPYQCTRLSRLARIGKMLLSGIIKRAEESASWTSPFRNRVWN